MVLDERLSLSAGRGGLNFISLYSGVGMETMTFLQLNKDPCIVVN